MLGEFRADHAYACGGAGAVLSRGAVQRLDLNACVGHLRRRCLQSDWQLGVCVRAVSRPAVRLEARHGCGTCAVAARNCSGAGANEHCRAFPSADAPPAGCQFMQEAEPYAQWLLAGTSGNESRGGPPLRGPSLVHGAGVAHALSLGTRRRRGAMAGS